VSVKRIIEWLRHIVARPRRRYVVAEPTRRPAEGEFSPDEDARREFPPEQGFGRAIRDALDKFDPEEWPPDTYERLPVKLTADVTITNPGQIDTYRASIG
jgi:hypothetical protein